MKILYSLLFICLSLSCFADDSTAKITVYHSPDCHCCKQWIKHLESNDFQILDKLSYDMASVKEAVKLPHSMASCHTAIIDGYIIEGHVPASDIKQLLLAKPDIAGLSVPRMPVGTPGMEMGTKKENFIVFQFDKSGKYSVFNEYTVDSNNENKNKNQD